MKLPTNFAELQDALLLLDARLTLEFSKGDDDGDDAYCAHLSTNTRPHRVSIEFGTTIEEAIGNAFRRHYEKMARYREQHPETVS